MQFKTDTITQNLIHVLVKEGKTDRLIGISDNYHATFKDFTDECDWKVEFERYIQRHHWRREVWRYILIEPQPSLLPFKSYGTVYFVGELRTVRTRIQALAK